jgi:predicted alpha/beta-fold hydrolase
MSQTPFTPPCWLRNPHLQTMWPKFFRIRPNLLLRRQRIELADGDFIDLTWAGAGSGPVVLLLHGLEGTLRSHYALPVMQALDRAGMQPVFMHLRGCSGEPNRLPRSYHSGASEDLAEVLDRLRANRQPVSAAIGFSLGGNLRLKYLGESGSSSLLQAAAAISVPFDLGNAARRLEQGASRIYRFYLLNRLKQSYRDKFSALPSPLKVRLDQIRTLWDYDEQVTAPLNGFAGADDYYHRCSSRGFLRTITTPTLILHAEDDPFTYPRDIPSPGEAGPGIRLAIQRHGGHVGFIEGRFPWRTRCLIDRIIPAFFHEKLTAF